LDYLEQVVIQELSSFWKFKQLPRCLQRVDAQLPRNCQARRETLKWCIVRPYLIFRGQLDFSTHEICSHQGSVGLQQKVALLLPFRPFLEENQLIPAKTYIRKSAQRPFTAIKEDLDSSQGKSHTKYQLHGRIFRSHVSCKLGQGTIPMLCGLL